MTYRAISFENIPPVVIYQGTSINKAYSIAETASRLTGRMTEVQMSTGSRWVTVQTYFYKIEQEG